MNFIKGLFGKGEEKNNMPQYMKNFQVQAEVYKRENKSSQVIMNKAVLTFMNDNKTNYSFYLYCKEEEQELFFPITAKLDLRQQTFENGDTKIIKYVFDLENSLQIRLEFDTSIIDEEQVRLFERYFSELIFLNIQQRPIKDDDEEKIKSNCKHVKKDLKDSNNNTISDVFSVQNVKKNKELSETQSNSDIKSLEKKMQNLQLSQTKKNSSKQEEQKKEEETSKNEDKQYQQIIKDNLNNQELQNAYIEILNQEGIRFAQIGTLYQLQEHLNQMLPKSYGIMFAIKQYENFNFKFQIYNSSKQVIHQCTLSDGHCLNIDQQQNTIKWLEFTEKVEMYLVKFDKKYIANEANFMIHQCLYEKNNKIPFLKAFNEDEIEYQRRFAEEDEEEINNNYKEDNREYIKDEEEVQNQIIEFDNSLVSQFSQSNYKSNVKNIQQAKIYDRTFVSKGQYIEIFRVKEDNENQDNLEHLCQLPIIKGLDGQSFEPRKILLQDEDTKILLLNELEQKKIYYYDIESGKIIQEFKCNENTVQDFAPQQKHPENTCFYGINSKNIFLMDPRKAEGKATSDVVQKSKIYDQNNKFTCVQSNEKGNFVIGSEDGSIRLFSEIGKMAKNKFVGFGDPILSIDTSKDLKWILATCKTYLILLPSYSAKDQQKDLYNNKVNYQDRRIPKKLTLNQEDLKALMVNQIGFTSAKFDDSINSLERFIVTSIGNFTVVWDFQKIIKGVKDCYEITRSDEIIQCAEFKFNSENKIFSASKSKLEVQKIHKSKKKN